MTVTAAASADLCARLAVRLVFVVLGGTQGGWMARIPAIRDQVGVETARWGLLSSSSAAGDVVAIVLITLLIGRVSTRLLALAGAAVVLLNAPVLAGASSVPAVVVGLTAWGVGATFLATPVNALAVAVERAHSRPLMSGFHACYSVGVLAGGVMGTLAAATDVSPGIQMAVSSGTLGTLLLVLGARLPRDAPTHKEQRRPLKHRFTPQLVLLAGIAFLGSFGEGAASQWSSVYTADYLDEGAALGAATYTSFSVAILAGRLLGDRFVARLGRRAFLRLSLLTSALGVTVVVVRPAVWLALTGFVVVGLGSACVLPSVIALAGRQPGVPAGEGVSVITIGQWPGFLLAGPAVGLLAGATSLRVALAALIVAGLGAAVLARRVVVPATG
ncbi:MULTISPECIES: MFS transporter [unclassified Streptomyces]|uniref:MFS transporter n=1 Tax=unclassified Streptomyces TaxID=2593676 RepID=UPI002258813E|nr:MULTISPECIES: MFS transporter [unclassified Streptomyces]MCX5062254.1 MFS transporter [Streptomyces sp. NBC_00452]MCX5292137.1 MFS transporter [Streptomyces sp. NBC_00183]